MTKQYANIADHVTNRSLYLEPTYARSLFGVLAPRMNFDIGNLYEDDGEGEYEYNGPTERQPSKSLRWYRHERYSHVGVMPVNGTLTHKGGGMMASLGTSYQNLQDNYEDMMLDDSISAIAMPYSCNGGHAAGCGSTASFFADNKIKPVYSLVDEAMYSAAMYVASPSDEIVTMPTAGNGSIGTVWPHIEWSQAIENEGGKVHIFRSGKHKYRGSDLEPLDKETIEKIQKEVDTDAKAFFEAVSEHRGISVDQVEGFQAATFQGQDSIDNGLADSMVRSPQEFYEYVAESASPPRKVTTYIPAAPSAQPVPEQSMPAAKATGAVTYSAEEMEAMKTQAAEEARAKLLQEQEDERKEQARIQQEKEAAALKRSNDILQSEAARDRPVKAQELINDPERFPSAEHAIATLEMLPVENEQSAFERGTQDPANHNADVPNDAGQSEEGESGMSQAEQSLYESCVHFGDSHDEAMAKVGEANRIKNTYGGLPAKAYGEVA